MAEDEYNFDYKSIASGGTLTAAGSDALANKAGLVISFYHVPSGKSVFFKAFITAFNETYAPDWAAETVYGRVDPIYLFKNTTRKISLAFKVPAASAGEAYENLSRVQQLVQFLYPTYTDVNSATTISQSPLVRLKVMNLARDAWSAVAITQIDAITEPTTEEELAAAEAELAKIGTEIPSGYTNYTSTTDSSRGLLGVINNLSIDHNLANSAAGVIEKKQNTILPKLIEVNLDFSPIHEHAVGWEEGTTLSDSTTVGTGELVFASPGFPYMGSEIIVGPKPAVGGTATTLGAEAMEFDKSDEEIAQETAYFDPGTNEDAGTDNVEAAKGTTFEADLSADEIEFHEDDG